MNAASTVRLANEIAAQFHYLDPNEGAKAVANHIRMFWDPSMRAQLLTLVDAGGEGLDELALHAAGKLREPAQ